MIKIIEDVILKEDANKLEQFLLSDEVPWYFKQNIDFEHIEDATPQNYGFVHVVYQYGKSISSLNAPCQEILKNICDKSGLSLNEVIRIKINLNPYCGEERFDLRPHTDILDQTNYISAIYYVNDSDGNTILYDVLKDSNTDDQSIIQNKSVLPIAVSQPPIKNTAIVFNGNRYHSGNTPLHHKTRININFCFR
jgi:hypothetical protein